MIPVPLAPEPDDFDARVRQPGQVVLQRYRAALVRWESARKGPPPRLDPLWRHCADDLMAAYHRQCAYACFYIHPVAGARTVEHLAPKSREPDLAYEWENYRLACALVNARKREFDDVLDPCSVGAGWFRIEFVSGTTYADPGLDASRRDQVRATIDRLGLNERLFTRTRQADFEDYQSGELNWRMLCRFSPFVAAEVARQGLRRKDDA